LAKQLQYVSRTWPLAAGSAAIPVKVVTSVGFGTRIGQLETKRKARSMRIDVAGLRNNSITLETSQALAVSRWE
jgi:hypothetical protein